MSALPLNLRKQALIIFIKNAESGKVKTRLAKDIGNENALTIYKFLLDHTRQVASALDVSRLLFYGSRIDPDDEWPEELYKKMVQKGHDLGTRMFNAFKEAFYQGCEQVIIIGSDCPEIDPGLLRTAFTKLEAYDFVLGPARDGGYYLLGMNYLENRLFINKNWSTDSVALDTLKDIQELNKLCYLMPELNDIDTIEDLSPELKKMIQPTH